MRADRRKDVVVENKFTLHVAWNCTEKMERARCFGDIGAHRAQVIHLFSCSASPCSPKARRTKRNAEGKWQESFVFSNSLEASPRVHGHRILRLSCTAVDLLLYC